MTRAAMIATTTPGGSASSTSSAVPPTKASHPKNAKTPMTLARGPYGIRVWRRRVLQLGDGTSDKLARGCQ